jgi:hypothetical protein
VIVVHITAVPTETEQRCVRCCAKLVDVDPAGDNIYRPGLFVAQKVVAAKDGLLPVREIIGIQETDAQGAQRPCSKRGSHPRRYSSAAQDGESA